MDGRQLHKKGGTFEVRRKRLASAGILAVLLLTGCAFDLAHVSFTPAQLAAQADANRSFTLKEAVDISAPCYNRTLRKDTRWDLVGRIPEGEVFKSKDQAMTVECSNVHEAYLVVSKGSLVGFYLPVEKGFVKITDAIKLPIKL